MKKVILDTLHIENFRRYQDPIEFNLDSPGLTFIKGSNGTGKTTIIEAIVWCLYGTTLKGRSGKSVATWEHLRPSSYKGTRVMLELFIDNIPYTVARHLDYKGTTEGYTGKSSLMVFKAGTLLQDLYKSDVQDTLISLIGVSESTFLNSILFGQRTSRMMAAASKDQKQFFAELFDLQYIEEARSRAKDEMNRITALIDLKNSQTEGMRIQLAGLIALENQHSIVLREWRDKQERLKVKVQGDIDETGAYLSELSGTYQILLSRLVEVPVFDQERFDELTNNLRELDRSISSIVNKITIRESQLDSKNAERMRVSTEEVTETCAVCGGKLKSDIIDKLKCNRVNRLSTLEAEIKELEQEASEARNTLALGKYTVETTEAELKELRHQYDQINPIREKNEKVKIGLGKVETEIAGNNKKLARLIEDRTRIAEEKEPSFDYESHDLKVSILKEQIEVESNGALELEKERASAAWWYKVGFTDNGLRFYVMESMMQEFNRLLRHYSKLFKIDVEVKGDFTGTRKEFVLSCGIRGVEVEYPDISGGEKQRVDLILTLALGDLISSKVVIFNCLFFDEAETGLDTEGMELFFEMLRTKKDKSIYLITHRIESDYTGSKTIEL